MWISILALALLPQSVEGLKQGETFEVGSPEAALTARECVRGRVIDGFTSKPVVGADVEIWAEGWKYPDAAIARGKTLVDGSFRLAHPGIEHVDKVLIRASGYRSTTLATSDAQEILLLPITKNLGLRVVDLEGKPIAGARMESRQTCAHAPHAYVGTSDADGRFDLSTFPPLHDDPEMIVSARGYGAVFLGGANELLLPGGLEVRLPRRKPIAFQVVDIEGKPLSHRRVSLGNEPEWVAKLTDETGRVQFDSPFWDRHAEIRIEHGGEAELLTGNGQFPSTFEPRFVFAPPSSEPPRANSTPPTLLPIHVVDANGTPIAIRIGAIHGSGADLAASAIGSNWGRTTVFAGGPFSGWNEVVRVLYEPVETTLRVTPEPVLELHLPADDSWIFHVQCGDDSVTFGAPQPPIRVSVPAGGPLIVCAVNATETRLARKERMDTDTVIDLPPSSAVVSSRPRENKSPDKQTRHQFMMVDDAKPSFSILTGLGEFTPQGMLSEMTIVNGTMTKALGVEFPTDPDWPFEGRVFAEGRVTRAFGTTIAPLGSVAASKIWLSRRGSLKVRGPVRALYAGGAEGESLAGGGNRVSELAPGPLLADVVRMDGSVVSLSLVLGDGEERELELR